jgi:hypothetical protein
MTQTEALKLALVALEMYREYTPEGNGVAEQAIIAIKAALEAKDEPYAFEASIYSNARMKVDPVTGNVSIGTVTKACGLECDCTDVCEQDDYKALWQQMCERCDELDKKLAQRTWVGLDVEDYIKALELCDFDKDAAFDFFEAKLKELNT